MLSEMCFFMDCYAKHVLRDKFNEKWPKNAELRNTVYLASVLESDNRNRENVRFLTYDANTRKFEILDRIETMNKLDQEQRDVLGRFIDNPYISGKFYDSNNKRLASTCGIGSFFPFIFKLPEKENKIEEKIEKTRRALEDYGVEEFIKIFDDQEFRKGLEKEILSLKKEKPNKDEREEKTQTYVLILFKNDVEPYYKFLEHEKLLDMAISDPKEGRCQICNEHGLRVGYPVVGSNYDSKKLFLTSPTKGKSRIGVCPLCGFKINAFYKLLNFSKIMPVFIDPMVTEIAAKNVRTFIRGEESYGKFMTRIYYELGRDENRMAHYLIILTKLTKNGLWVDYVSSLKWELGWKKVHDNKEGLKTRHNRKEIEEIFVKALMGNSEDQNVPSWYFGDVRDEKGLAKKVGRYSLYLIYKYRDHLYRFTYKNEQPFAKQDIIEFVNFSIAERYYDLLQNRRSKKNLFLLFGDSIKSSLEIFFNMPVLMGGEPMKDLVDLRRSLDKIITDKSEEIGDEEWAYSAGAFYRYLVGLTKAKEPQLQLEPIINASTVKEVIDLLAITFERYQHAIRIPYLMKWGGISACSFVREDLNKSFLPLKPYFYAGFTDPYAQNKFYGQTNGGVKND
ncbi:MAG: hypothetical protein QXP42_02870 [Candidatus Micrarchaeia archaeon]